MNDQDETLYEVVEPAILFDKECFVLHKIGNRQDVMNYYENCIEKCKATGSNLFESWVVMDLPKDAKLLDNILQNSSSLKTIIEQDLKLNIDF